MNRKAVGLAASIALIGGLTCHAGVPLQISSHGETKVVALLGGAKVSADLLSHEVAIGTASEQPPKRRTLNCTYSHVPCMLIDSLEITVDGREVFIPRSVFGDLSDVWTAQLRQVAPGRYGLTLVGGDASEGYSVEIVFDRRRVRERVLTDGEAHQVAEKTVYYDLSGAFQ